MSDEMKKKLSEAKKGKPSPRKGKKLSEETKKKISQANKGNQAWNKGKSPSSVTRKKISEATKKQMASKEIREKISRTWFKKGEPSPRKGKKLSNETKKKISEANKGKLVGDKHPMKGKKHSEKSIKKMKESHKNITDETKNKISKANKGRISPFKGVTERYSEETIRKLSESRNKQTFPIKDSKPEKMVQKGLSLAKISFITQKSFKVSKGYHKVDIFIEPNICIECDGNYWHADPKYPDDTIIIRNRTAKMIRENDKKIVQDLENQGNIVHRFWQTEIEEDLNKCINKIKKSISQNNNF